MQNAVVDDPEIATRIGQYELAFKMQTSVPALMDLKDEPAKILDCTARRAPMARSRPTACSPGGSPRRACASSSSTTATGTTTAASRQGIKFKIEEIDRPLAALIKDLKRLGMFDDTLIVLTGEFGRTPMSQGGNGRDHHMKGFCVVLAGGGIKRGLTYGATDEFGYNAEENVFPVHDLHATMLYLLGVDHERLTFKFQGRDYRLTDVHGHVVKDILA